MTLRRSPKLYARPRASGYPRVQSTCSSKRRVSAPTASAPRAAAKLAGLDGQGGQSVDDRGARGGHWRRRVAVEIGRGRVNCLGRSADPGYKGNSNPSAETAPYELR